ncbi:MAG: 16S rRNA (guanine(966)-N(2))-methyltransferase RsmD [Thiotrichales bacterium]|nr:MAG: 16S rRNA (guanine(966)-N(2))-methyltransferase RsmD [Thiotrichales bacterium]
MSVRIISGIWKGRKLEVVDSKSLRPSTDRVRKTIFDWLRPHIIEAKCLDAFAGTGVIGLEALSSGANQTVFIEKNRHISRILKDNLNKLQVEEAGILVKSDALHYLNKASHIQFDLVFLDPPFESNLLEKSLSLLHQHNWVHANSLVYFECAAACEINFLHWKIYKHKTTKNIQYGLLQLS